MQLKAFSGLQEGAGNPAGRKAQQAARGLQLRFHQRPHVGLLGMEGGDVIHKFIEV
jgi:hypothetical protein